MSTVMARQNDKAPLDGTTLPSEGTAERRFPGRARPRLLIAEDDVALRQLMAASLAVDGYEIDEAVSGIELFARLARLRLPPPSGQLDQLAPGSGRAAP